MAGNSESYTKDLERRRANILCDRRELAALIESGEQRSRPWGRTREQLEARIAFRERSLAIGESY